MPDSDSWRLKPFKGQHFCWTLLGFFTSVGHTGIVPENKKFLHLLYLWSTEESAVHPICCDSSPNSTVTCQEVPQNSLTLLTGTTCFHLFCPLERTPLETSGPTENASLPASASSCVSCVQLIILQIIQGIHKLEVSHNQFLLSKPQVKNRNARQDERYEHE